MPKKSINRKDVIHAVRLAARDAAARVSANPLYVEALELAARALEDNDWAMPRRHAQRIKASDTREVLMCSDAYVMGDD